MEKEAFLVVGDLNDSEESRVLNAAFNIVVDTTDINGWHMLDVVDLIELCDDALDQNKDITDEDRDLFEWDKDEAALKKASEVCKKYEGETLLFCVARN